MSSKTRAKQTAKIVSKKQAKARLCNRDLFLDLIRFVIPETPLFSKDEFHGNVKWDSSQLSVQALIWSWQDTKNVTDAFEKTLEICEELGLKQIVGTYTAFMNAISRYRNLIFKKLQMRFQGLVKQIHSKHFRTKGWVLIGFDGSRSTAARSVQNEAAFCAPNYGLGTTAKYRKRKSNGLRSKRKKTRKTLPPEPQIWITMMWHMNLRLPWTWRLGPSNSSERQHVHDMIQEEEFPEETLFCGDAGFVGYSLWKSIIDSGHHFLCRVGANVHLLSDQVTLQRISDSEVLCWPKDAMNADEVPLRLRLVRVKIGKTMMWMLTSVLDKKKLSASQIREYYKMRWGIEVEFRGLKQTIDKHKLRCRNSQRALAELDWSIRGMAIAELLSVTKQVERAKHKKVSYNAIDRSLAKTLKAIRRCMRRLPMAISEKNNLQNDLMEALVDRYNNRTDKRARYRPKNSDIKPLGDPKIRKLMPEERKHLKEQRLAMAA